MWDGLPMRKAGNSNEKADDRRESRLKCYSGSLGVAPFLGISATRRRT